jgi:hypothetical protein
MGGGGGRKVGGCNKIFQISYKLDQSSNFQYIIYIPPQHKTEGSVIDPVLSGPDLGPRMLFKNYGFGSYPFTTWYKLRNKRVLTKFFPCAMFLY